MDPIIENQNNNKTYFKLLFYLYILLVFILSIYPFDKSIDTGNDKINHIAAYTIYSILFISAFGDKNKKLMLLTGLVYGTSIEFIQYFLPYRSFELLDIAANAAGLFLGLFLTAGTEIFIKRRKYKKLEK